MNKLNKKRVFSALLITALIAVVGFGAFNYVRSYVSPANVVIENFHGDIMMPEGSSLGGQIHNVLESFDEGIAVDGTVVIDGSGNIDAPITSTTGTFSGAVSIGGTLAVTGITTLSEDLIVGSAAIFSVASVSGDIYTIGDLSVEDITASSAMTLTGHFSGSTASMSSVVEIAGALKASSSFEVIGESNLDTLVQGGDYVTISSGSETLSAAQVCDTSVLKFTATASSTNMTFPTGASLIADCLPGNADKKSFYLITDADDETLTLVTGSTMNLLEASPSGDVVFEGADKAIIEFINIDGTNVDVTVDHYQDAD